MGMSQVLGGSALGGVGFGVSLFVTGLAFPATVLRSNAKTGIVIGSLLAALVAVGLLPPQPGPPDVDVSPVGERTKP